MKSPVRVVLVGAMGSLAGMLSRALVDLPEKNGIVVLKEGDTIELEPGDIVLLPSPEKKVSLEELKAFDAAVLDLKREIPPARGGCHEGTAFHDMLPKYRRRNKRRSRRN